MGQQRSPLGGCDGRDGRNGREERAARARVAAPLTWRVGSLALSRPVVLAPMEGYSDQAFRRLCRAEGASLAYTEFTSATQLCGHPRARRYGAEKIALAADERPAGIQIYGRDPDQVAAAARVAAERAPELIDLNFGCPAKKVGRAACGSQLMREPERLLAIAAAVVRSVRCPVTCKLRLGWDDASINVVDIALRLQELGVQGITVHGRTRCQKYEGQADWDWIGRVVDALEIPVIGNGDVCSAADAVRMFEHTGAAAVMIGRAATRAPWIFRAVRARIDRGVDIPDPPPARRLELLIRHFDMTLAHKGSPRGLRHMRKHFATYLRCIPDADVLRRELVRLDDAEEVLGRLHALRATLPRESEAVLAGDAETEAATIAA